MLRRDPRVSYTGVTGPSGDESVGNRLARSLAELTKNVKNRTPSACAQVPAKRTRFLQQVVECSQKSSRELHHMDVIANSCAVSSRVVVAKDPYWLVPSYSYLSNEGNRSIGVPCGSSPIRPDSCAPTGFK